ncbi:glucosaminidase domain-containing protein [Bacteroidales bacterium OttesenSCG-928-M06]|nr:glucosaminidase domain-containing protein [Bacteroidales bacterium OttesenSCG-928-M06]
MKQKVYFLLLLLFFVNTYNAYAKQPILTKPSANVDQMKAWAKAKGATLHFIGLADIFWTTCISLGVDPVVAYCQSGKETGYGKYNGAVSLKHKNTCGLKKENRNDDNPEDHAVFATWEDGIMAHVEHLALYAGASGFPKKESERKDTRHYGYLKGQAKTVEELGGKWAVSKTYGIEIVALMKEVKKF